MTSHRKGRRGLAPSGCAGPQARTGPRGDAALGSGGWGGCPGSSKDHTGHRSWGIPENTGDGGREGRWGLGAQPQQPSLRQTGRHRTVSEGGESRWVCGGCRHAGAGEGTGQAQGTEQEAGGLAAAWEEGQAVGRRRLGHILRTQGTDEMQLSLTWL